VAEVLTDLAGQGARMAVVTSTLGDRARHHLEVAGLLGHVEFVLGGDEVRATKPDPAPYLQAAERLGVNPNHSAAFEDSDRGIAAAVAAGCHAVQIPDLRPVDKPLPDLGQMVARTLAEAVSMAQHSVANKGR
jgi:beta-phosphoglucomutase-like phosphatase (HAD superfamily)